MAFSRTFRVVVGNKSVTMLALGGASLEEVKRSVEQRFGADRVKSVERIIPKTVRVDDE